MKKIVIALGGNALQARGEAATSENQLRNVMATAEHIARIIGEGYEVIISHGNGYTTLYAHCLSLVVHAGQSVKQGQLIGYVGSTGRSSGNHCHFEIRRNGSYIAPQNVFNRSKYR